MSRQHRHPLRARPTPLPLAFSALGLCLTLCSPLASAQNPLLKGTDQTLEVATWNIEWFGGPNGPTDDARQIANVTTVIQKADIDLWALQEIADENAFNTLLTNLGAGYDGRLAPTSAQQGLGLAFVFKTSVVQLRRLEEILTQFTNDFAGRPPFELEADVTIDGATTRATFIVVHMKANSEMASYEKRVAASGRVKNHIDFTALTSEPVIVLGDMNDLLSGSITLRQPSPYKNFVDDANYATPTLALQLDGRNTWCGSSTNCSSGSAIDHIIVSNEAEPWYVDNSADHFDELLSEISSYVFSTSDHLPVLARFVLTSTDVRDEPVPVSSRQIESFPNPFSDRVSVRYAIARPGYIGITLFDLLGRTVLARTEWKPSGTFEDVLETHDLARGMYVLRVVGPDGRVALTPVVRQ